MQRRLPGSRFLPGLSASSFCTSFLVAYWHRCVHLAEGLRDLGLSDFRVRLPQPKASELSNIAQRFNSLASALETMMVKNRKLSTRLITVQDLTSADRRRSTFTTRSALISLASRRMQPRSSTARRAALPKSEHAKCLR